MKTALPSPTIAEQRRFYRFQDVGCIACIQLDPPRHSVPEVHHLLSGGRRRGHRYTVPLCPWHHRGVGGPVRQRAAILGPSLAISPDNFRLHFGCDEDLLTMTDAIINKLNELVRSHMPYEVACDVPGR